ncbi:aspartyl/asparaginyl beta-hydroxylase domain-containing protein [Roseateles cellulosilyticus]|uniref:Aspartyl/asparaginyl beta-hydroxylase domain-containing protein n=1 Tax=Pelomonas cellulosilytica TaxID=2906762 RepID=A0ABS8XSI3_9BURK|nr:aspartyl/asparaginyl beta-hydroxylase domain-containing protein [Pelomonas sp. P8]
MDYHSPKRAVNHLLLRYAGQQQRPVFFDIDVVYPSLRALERAYALIRAECDALLAERVDMPRYHDVNRPATAISATTPGDWKVFMLELLGHRPGTNRALCPATCAALAEVPGVLQAFFSVLDPGKSIPAHDGPYLGYLRYHLGVRVPRRNPPIIRVAGQRYEWKEGEGVLFDDSWPHEVINEASEPRVVLIVDVPRPLPLLPRLVNHFVLWGLAAPLYGKKVVQKADRHGGDLLA